MDPQKYVLRRDLTAGRDPAYRIDYQGALNSAQHEAVTHRDGPLLVVAGAGTGKTRTLVFRVARLVESGIDPARILLLTFTRKAATEMLGRASALLDGRCDRVAGGTFHSFANTTLRRHGSALGIASSFTILDRSDAEDAINLLRAGLGLDRKERRFPRKQTIAEIFSMAVNKSRPLSALVEEQYSHLVDHLPDLADLHEAYQAYKAARQLLDYDDLLVRLWQLLDGSEEVCRTISNHFQYIMVDEYQDTNALQARIVQLLGRTHGNVMAVGDDAQSVYSFRGADFRNIMDFPTLFPGARVIALEHNYRSTQPILDLSNAIIDQARERHEKHLFSAGKTGGSPLLIPAENEHFQSRFVAQRILELREEGVPLEEIAVLFRSSFHSFALELELTQHDIPFVKRGGFKFLETAHIKDVLAHVRVLLNPRDAVAWYRILMLVEGIGPRSSEEIVRILGDGEDVVARLAALPKRPYSTELEMLGALLAQGAGLIEVPEQLINLILRYYDPILKRVHPDDHPKRRKDLEQFATIAARYTHAGQLLAEMALDPPNDSVGDTLAVTADGERLTLSTIHSAKGLEWHTVFVIWVAEGKFPSAYVSSDEELEEERRLMYVAVTRAKQELYLTYPVYVFDRQLGTVLAKASQFLDAIPATVLPTLFLSEEGS